MPAGGLSQVGELERELSALGILTGGMLTEILAGDLLAVLAGDLLAEMLAGDLLAVLAGGLLAEILTGGLPLSTRSE